jgi:serine/threonine protein kinase
VYGLSLVLFELLTGHFPWKLRPGITGGELEALHKRHTGRPYEPWHFRRDFPEELGRIIMQGFEKDPGARPTPRQILDILMATPDEKLWADHAPADTPQPRAAAAHMAPLAILGLVAPIAAGVALLFYLTNRTPGLSIPPTPMPTLPSPTPTPPPHLRALYQGGAIIIANASDQTFDRVLLTIPGPPEHRCTLDHEFAPRSSRMVPLSCWDPVVDESALPVAILAEERSGTAVATETVPLAGLPERRAVNAPVQKP